MERFRISALVIVFLAVSLLSGCEPWDEAGESATVTDPSATIQMNEESKTGSAEEREDARPVAADESGFDEARSATAASESDPPAPTTTQPVKNRPPAP